MNGCMSVPRFGATIRRRGGPGGFAFLASLVALLAGQVAHAAAIDPGGAAVVRDVRMIDSPDGRIMVGAAVIDDVLGLLVLAVVAGAIQAADRGTTFDARALALILAKAAGFLIVAVVAGAWLSRRVFR